MALQQMSNKKRVKTETRRDETRQKLLIRHKKHTNRTRQKQGVRKEEKCGEEGGKTMGRGAWQSG